MGRGQKYPPAVVERVIESLAMTDSDSATARRLRLPRSTVRNIRFRAEEGTDDPYGLAKVRHDTRCEIILQYYETQIAIVKALGDPAVLQALFHAPGRGRAYRDLAVASGKLFDQLLNFEASLDRLPRGPTR